MRGTDYLQLDGEVPLSPRWNPTCMSGARVMPAILAMPLANGARDPGYADFTLAASYALDHRWTLAATPIHATNAAFHAHVASFRDPFVHEDLGGTRAVLTLSIIL